MPAARSRSAPAGPAPSVRDPGTDPGLPVGAILLVVVSAACFGAMAIFARAAYAAGVDVWGILLPRFAIAAAVFALVAHLRGLPRVPAGRRAPLAAMGAAYVAQACCYFGALLFVPAGLVALLLYLFPLFVVLMSRALGHDALTGRRLLALSASLAGTALAIGPGSLAGDGPDWRGVALGLAAAAIYACYIVGGARATRGIAPVTASAAIMTAGTAVLAAIVAARVATGSPVAFATDVAGWSAVAAAALVSTVVAVSTFFAGLARLGPSRTSVISTIEPVVTVGLAALLLGERLSPVQAVGGALVLAGALLIATERATPRPAARG